MKSLFLLFIVILIFTQENANSQISQQWVQRYNGSGNGIDEAYSSAIDIDGNVYVTGKSFLPASNYDFATVKYNSGGVQLWAKRYDNVGGIDEANSIVLDNSGNVYVTGKSQGGASNSDFVTIKYNSNGDQLWLRSYNGLGNGIDNPVIINIDNNGNVYVTGISWGGSSYDIATLKYNSNGVNEYAVRYNGTGNGDDFPVSMHTDINGLVYVTGGSEGTGSGYDVITIMYLQNGNANWIRRYNGPDNSYDFGRSITSDNNGNIIVTGESNFNNSGYDYNTIKYNQNGDLLWASGYNGTGNGDDLGVSVKTDDQNNIYVTGSSNGIGTNEDYVTLKYNSAGTQQWLQRLNGSGNGRDVPKSMVIGIDNSLYITGTSLNSGNFDYASVKYDTSGVEKWVRTYNGNGSGLDAATSIAINNQEFVVVTGLSYGGSGTSYDYASVKYSQSTGIQNISNEIPGEFMLHQNYPNPFNPTTNIKFDILKAGNVKMTITDISGRVISEPINSKMTPGSYVMDFNANELSSGIYFYTLLSNDFRITKKMTVLK